MKAHSLLCCTVERQTSEVSLMVSTMEEKSHPVRIFLKKTKLKVMVELYSQTMPHFPLVMSVPLWLPYLYNDLITYG